MSSPLPATPVDNSVIDFSVIGKEIANELAVEILIKNMSHPADRDAVKTRLEHHLKHADSAVDKGLDDLTLLRSRERANKPVVKQHFKKQINLILKNLASRSRSE